MYCSNVENFKKIPKADIVFMFKFLDPIEKAYGKGHKLAEEIIQCVKAMYVVASFAKKTLSGKTMRHSYRGWIERMLDRLERRYWKIETGKEIYYVIKK